MGLCVSRGPNTDKHLIQNVEISDDIEKHKHQALLSLNKKLDEFVVNEKYTFRPIDKIYMSDNNGNSINQSGQENEQNMYSLRVSTTSKSNINYKLSRKILCESKSCDATEETFQELLKQVELFLQNVFSESFNFYICKFASLDSGSVNANQYQIELLFQSIEKWIEGYNGEGLQEEDVQSFYFKYIQLLITYYDEQLNVRFQNNDKFTLWHCGKLNNQFDIKKDFVQTELEMRFDSGQTVDKKKDENDENDIKDEQLVDILTSNEQYAQLFKKRIEEIIEKIKLNIVMNLILNYINLLENANESNPSIQLIKIIIEIVTNLNLKEKMKVDFNVIEFYKEAKTMEETLLSSFKVCESEIVKNQIEMKLETIYFLIEKVFSQINLNTISPRKNEQFEKFKKHYPKLQKFNSIELNKIIEGNPQILTESFERTKQQWNEILERSFNQLESLSNISFHEKSPVLLAAQQKLQSMYALDGFSNQQQQVEEVLQEIQEQHKKFHYKFRYQITESNPQKVLVKSHKKLLNLKEYVIQILEHGNKVKDEFKEELTKLFEKFQQIGSFIDELSDQ